MEKVEFIWSDGELVAWENATDHVLAHTMHYGVGAFEGIRCYEHEDGRQSIFRLEEHIQRLLDSCKIATIDVPFTKEQLVQACAQVISKNKLKSAYIRPLVYLGYSALGLGSLSCPTRTIVAAYEWGAYLGEDGLKKGIRCKTSAFRRGNVDSVVSKGKLCGQYVTGVLAKRDALKDGFDEALMMDSSGCIAEGSGENIFVVKNNIISTPAKSHSILPGITRDSVMKICDELGYKVVEESCTRDDIWTADEVFLTGTAAEVTPVREIDHRVIGKGLPGPMTTKIQSRYFEEVKGKEPKYSNWHHYI